MHEKMEQVKKKIFQLGYSFFKVKVKGKVSISLFFIECLANCNYKASSKSSL